MSDLQGTTSSPVSAIVALAPDAAFAVARELQRSAMGAVALGARVSVFAIGSLLAVPPVRIPLERLETRVGVLAARGAEWRRQDATRATKLVRRAEPVLAQMLQRAVDLLPIEALLARVDVDALVHRVDVETLVARIDLPRVVGEVLAAIELGDLIHDSTTSIAADARDAVRLQALSIDGRLARLIDRILSRRDQRDVVLPGYKLRGAT